MEILLLKMLTHTLTKMYNEEVNILNANIGEVTINLHPTKTNVTINTPAYLEIKNNKPRITVDTNKPTILNNKKTISTSNGAEITIKLNTKFIQV
mgnify:CR=1 FL=1|jgi:hypothetical protein